MKKSKVMKKDFFGYFIAGLFIQLLSNLITISGLLVGNSLLTTLIIMDTASMAMAGFSFYFYLFHKDKKALNLMILLIIFSIAVYLLESFLISVLKLSSTITSSFSILEFFKGVLMSILGFFIEGIIIYLMVRFIFWVYRKIKKVFE